MAGPQVYQQQQGKDWIEALAIGVNAGSQISNMVAQFKQIQLQRDKAAADLFVKVVEMAAKNTDGGERAIMDMMKGQYVDTVSNLSGRNPEEVGIEFDQSIGSDSGLLFDDALRRLQKGVLDNFASGENQQGNPQQNPNPTVPGGGQIPVTNQQIPVDYTQKETERPPMKSEVDLIVTPEANKPPTITETASLNKATITQIIKEVRIEMRNLSGKPEEEINAAYKNALVTKLVDKGVSQEEASRMADKFIEGNEAFSQATTTTEPGYMIFTNEDDVQVGTIEMKKTGDRMRPTLVLTDKVKAGNQVESLWETAKELIQLSDPSLKDVSTQDTKIFLGRMLTQPANMKQMIEITGRTEEDLLNVLDIDNLQTTEGVARLDELTGQIWTKMDIVLPVDPRSLDWMLLFRESTPEKQNAAIEQIGDYEEEVIAYEKDPTPETVMAASDQLEVVRSLQDYENLGRYNIEHAMKTLAFASDPNVDLTNPEAVSKAADDTWTMLIDQILDSPAHQIRVNYAEKNQELLNQIQFEKDKLEWFIEHGIDINAPTPLEQAQILNYQSQTYKRAADSNIDQGTLEMKGIELGMDRTTNAQDQAERLYEQIEEKIGGNWAWGNDMVKATELYKDDTQFTSLWDSYVENLYYAKGYDPTTFALPTFEGTDMPKPPTRSIIYNQSPVFGGLTEEQWRAQPGNAQKSGMEYAAYKAAYSGIEEPDDTDDTGAGVNLAEEYEQFKKE